MFGFLTSHAKDAADPLASARSAALWLKQLPALDVIGRQQQVMRAFDAMRQSRKPVDPARMQALLRRAGGWASPILECGPIRLDTRAQTVTLNDKAIELTTFEYRILEHMMLRAGDVISKTELTERLYDQDFERDSNVIEVFIGRLRRKLDPDETLHPIETLRGRGYRFALVRK